MPAATSGGSALGGFAPGAHERLKLHAERVGDAVDVVEVADDLRGVVDRRIREASRAQAVNVRLSHRRGRRRQLIGEGAQPGVRVVEAGVAPIARERVDPSIGGGAREVDLGTEVVGVAAQSIRAAVGLADDHGEHLALPTRQLRRPVHHGLI